MGLDPAHQQLEDPPAFEVFEKLGAAPAAKPQLGGNLAQSLGQLGKRAAQALGILLSGDRRDAQDLGPVDQPSYVPDDPLVAGDCRDEPLLHVHDQKSRVARGHHLRAARKPVHLAHAGQHTPIGPRRTVARTRLARAQKTRRAE